MELRSISKPQQETLIGHEFLVKIFPPCRGVFVNLSQIGTTKSKHYI
jgi:hypothetical protein